MGKGGKFSSSLSIGNFFKVVLVFQVLSLVVIVGAPQKFLDENINGNNFSINEPEVGNDYYNNQRRKFTDNSIPVPRKIPGRFPFSIKLPDSFSKRLEFLKC